MKTRRFSVVCPHCGYPCRVRTSRRITKLSQQKYCQCLNVICGFTFVMATEIIRTISPSAIPDESLNLPQCVPRQSDSDTQTLDLF